MPDGSPAMFSQKSGFTEISKQEPGVFLLASFHRMRHIENICAHFQKQTLRKASRTRPLKLLCVSHRFTARNRERKAVLGASAHVRRPRHGRAVQDLLCCQSHYPGSGNKRRSYPLVNNPRRNTAAWVLRSHWDHGVCERDPSEARKHERAIGSPRCKNLHRNGNGSKMSLSGNDFIRCLRRIHVQNIVIPALCKVSVTLQEKWEDCFVDTDKLRATLSVSDTPGHSMWMTLSWLKSQGTDKTWTVLKQICFCFKQFF